MKVAWIEGEVFHGAHEVWKTVFGETISHLTMAPATPRFTKDQAIPYGFCTKLLAKA